MCAPHLYPQLKFYLQIRVIWNRLHHPLALLPFYQFPSSFWHEDLLVLFDLHTNHSKLLQSKLMLQVITYTVVSSTEHPSQHISLEGASEPKTNCNCWQEAEMHPCLLKIEASMRRDYVCLIGPARVCPLRWEAKWRCPRSPTATAQRMFSDDWICHGCDLAW